jgi:alanine dehydrogenase
MLILNAAQVKQALPMAQAIEAMKSAYAAISNGDAHVPLRSHLEISEHRGINLYMPAHLKPTGGGETLVVKIVAVYPDNPAANLPIIHASVLISEAATGKPVALLEGGSLTAIRTGAGAGAATDLLARPDSHTVAVIGAGVQARTQLESVCTVRPIERVKIYCPTPAKIEALIAELAGWGPIPRDLIATSNPADAIKDADIICTATTSSTPVFADADVMDGTHINAIGAFTPDMAEIPPETVGRSRVYIDSREASLAEAGDLIQAEQAGAIAPDHIQGEIGEIILGRLASRQTIAEITLFKSVGVAVQDAAAAQLALENASRQGLGQQVQL